MSFAIDDADSTISYSANGWAVQSPNDPDLDQFFQQTYHVATQDQASMSFTFSGSAFALHGSKGPDHATFQVQFDSTVVNLDASAPTTAFRQVLFSHSFSDNGTAALHLVKLTASLGGKNMWLDLDYITFTSGGGSTSSIGTATSAPPWLTDPSQTGQSTSPTGPSGFTIPSSSPSPNTSSAASSPSSKAPTILAALFGAILGLALLGLALWLALRRVSAGRRARERAFRYGQSSVNPSAALSAASVPGNAPSNNDPASVKGGYPPSATSASASASALGLVTRSGTASPFTHSQRDASLSLASNVVNAAEMRGVSLDERERERASTPATMASRGLMSQSPIAWTTRKMGGGHRGDADSLRTDFLQV